MNELSNRHSSARSRRRPRSLAEMLFRLSKAEDRQQLEEFRAEYEAVHGKTDLTKRYTSLWPMEHQLWLLEHDTKAYFDGLPPFVKAFFKGKIQLTAKEGRLDNVSDHYLKLFMSGQMNLDCDLHER